MPIEKPKKPTELIPRAFGGIKNNFSDDLQSTGFEPNIPQTYNGDNLNYHLDATGKELDYVEKVVDFINQAPVNHIPFVNENNQLDYIDANSLGSGAFDMFDTKISDHILEGNESKGWALQGTYVSGALYPDFYNKCLEQKTSATETSATLGSSTLTMFVNDNGHQFYNIADKSIVDTFYNACGIADFYGIDEENQRVFLPRNKYFALTGGVMGNGMTLGLTDNTSNYGSQVVSSGSVVAFLGFGEGNYGQPVGTVGDTYSKNTNYKSMGITTDPTKSGIALETNENKYLYYCVGNTVVNNAEIDAGGLVAQMERKANVNFDNVLPEGKASASSWSLPSNRYVDLELGAHGSTYTAPANGWAVLSAKLTSGKHISIYNPVTKIGTTAMFNTSSGYIQGFVNVPCKKGDIFEIYHNSPTELITFRFIYAEGEV